MSHCPIYVSEGSLQLLWGISRKGSKRGQEVKQLSGEKRPSPDKGSGRWHGEKWMDLRAESRNVFQTRLQPIGEL